MEELFLKRFLLYKDIADKTFSQLDDNEVLWQYNSASNSIATIVKHLSGNMLSRWSDFLSEDGEKPWRNRDSEFENDVNSKTEMLEIWAKGWKVFLAALDQITPENMNDTITIRGEKLSVGDAVLRQLAHYSYHIGQIVYIGKMLKNEKWETLSIAKNKSREYNADLLNENSERENSSPVCFAKSNEVRDEYKDS